MTAAWRLKLTLVAGVATALQPTLILKPQPGSVAMALKSRVRMMAKEQGWVESMSSGDDEPSNAMDDQDDSDGDDVPLDEDDSGPFSAREQLVDAMQTSLGREAELMPHAGPTIHVYDDSQSESRPLFVHLGIYTPGFMPTDGSVHKYFNWLEDGSAERVCLPQYLLGHETLLETVDLIGAHSNDMVQIAPPPNQ